MVLVLSGYLTDRLARICFLENLKFELTGELTAFQGHGVPPRSEGSFTLCLGRECSADWYEMVIDGRENDLKMVEKVLFK